MKWNSVDNEALQWIVGPQAQESRVQRWLSLTRLMLRSGTCCGWIFASRRCVPVCLAPRRGKDDVSCCGTRRSASATISGLLVFHQKHACIPSWIRCVRPRDGRSPSNLQKVALFRQGAASTDLRLLDVKRQQKVSDGIIPRDFKTYARRGNGDGGTESSVVQLTSNPQAARQPSDCLPKCRMTWSHGGLKITERRSCKTTSFRKCEGHV